MLFNYKFPFNYKTRCCGVPVGPAGRRRVAAECDAERHEEDDDEGGEGEVEPVGLEPRAVGDRLHPDLAHVRVVVGRLDGAGHGGQAVQGCPTESYSGN